MSGKRSCFHEAMATMPPGVKEAETSAGQFARSRRCSSCLAETGAGVRQRRPGHPAVRC